jgi:hypothetical protein
MSLYAAQQIGGIACLLFTLPALGVLVWAWRSKSDKES